VPTQEKGGEKETLMAANKLIHYQPSPVSSHHDDGEEFDAIPVRARLMLKYLTESEWKIVLMCSDEGEKWMCRVDIEAEKSAIKESTITAHPSPNSSPFEFQLLSDFHAFFPLRWRLEFFLLFFCVSRQEPRQHSFIP
jgi:hypothetical protein